MAQNDTANKAGRGLRHRPDRRIDLSPCAKRIRACVGGEAIADSTRTLLLLEAGHSPVYYFPRDDVRMDLMRRTARSTHCPFKGDAAYWTVAAGGSEAENAAWSYEAPLNEVEDIRGHVAFYWDRMDQWLEEDEEVAVHPRNPFVRIDVLVSRRPVRVMLAGQALAETERALFLFETGHPVRYYIPEEDVRSDLLIDSDTRTGCPYKGSARYWSASFDGRTVEDVAWSYPVPLGEVRRIASHICFSDERVDAIEVDGRTVSGAERR